MKEQDPYKWFDNKRNLLKNATSVKELTEIDVDDLDPRIDRDEYKGMLMKTLNRKFKGDLEKSREYIINRLSEGFQNYMESEMEQPWQR